MTDGAVATNNGDDGLLVGVDGWSTLVPATLIAVGTSMGASYRVGARNNEAEVGMGKLGATVLLAYRYAAAVCTLNDNGMMDAAAVVDGADEVMMGDSAPYGARAVGIAEDDDDEEDDTGGFAMGGREYAAYGDEYAS